MQIIGHLFRFRRVKFPVRDGQLRWMKLIIKQLFVPLGASSDHTQGTLNIDSNSKSQSMNILFIGMKLGQTHQLNYKCHSR